LLPEPPKIPADATVSFLSDFKPLASTGESDLLKAPAVAGGKNVKCLNSLPKKIYRFQSYMQREFPRL
jgi:hypothetical protein